MRNPVTVSHTSSDCSFINISIDRSDYVSFHQQYGRAIIKKFRRSFTQEELDRGFPVTFTEYISYITSFKVRDIILLYQYSLIFHQVAAPYNQVLP